MLKLYEHPLSAYAMKVKIALNEKGLDYETAIPEGMATGTAGGDFVAANPRGEVPTLVDGDFQVFDSTVILEYIEEKWPDPALLPGTPAERARVRMIEDVMDTQYEQTTGGRSRSFVTSVRRENWPRRCWLTARGISNSCKPGSTGRWAIAHGSMAMFLAGAIFQSFPI